MDRIDAMKVFVVVTDAGSLACAGRKLGRSPAAVSRAITFLEARAGVALLHRAKWSVKLSEAGERYAAICRRILMDLEEAETTATGERPAQRGSLTVTAPVRSGELVLRPILDAFMDAYPAVSARLYLFDDPVSLIDEGIDVALRIGALADPALVAARVGEVRQVLAAAPRYLARHPLIEKPGDLAQHQIIAQAILGIDSWSFPPLPGSSVHRAVEIRPRLVTNSGQGAVASAVDGHGVARLMSYQVAEHVREGELKIVLPGDEHPPLPVHLVALQGRIVMPLVRAFVDFAVPRLRSKFLRLTQDADDTGTAIRS